VRDIADEKEKEKERERENECMRERERERKKERRERERDRELFLPRNWKALMLMVQVACFILQQVCKENKFNTTKFAMSEIS
jgi:hypothetical protein